MDTDKSYGSFFSLEVPERALYDFENEFLLLNTGRNAFEYVLRVKKPSKVYLPSLSCRALYDPLNRLNLPFELYSVDNNFEPIFDYSSILDSETFLYINYYGLKDAFINKLKRKVSNLILDNTQAFFSKTDTKIPTFNSLRKFFGVPDGAMLFNVSNDLKLDEDKSSKRFRYLIRRLEESSEKVYPAYQEIEDELDSLPLRAISDSTLNVFKSINFNKYKEIRKENFTKYHIEFKRLNKLEIEDFESPYMYPLWINNGRRLKRVLQKYNIFIASFWQNVLADSKASFIEKELVSDVLPLPVDQRYNSTDIKHIIKIIKCELEKDIGQE